jgi:hypothetical protein
LTQPIIRVLTVTWTSGSTLPVAETMIGRVPMFARAVVALTSSPKGRISAALLPQPAIGMMRTMRARVMPVMYFIAFIATFLL